MCNGAGLTLPEHDEVEALLAHYLASEMQALPKRRRASSVRIPINPPAVGYRVYRTDLLVAPRLCDADD